MPVAEFPGRFGWGYDGVDLFAPTRPLRRARRFPPLRRSRPRARPRRHPRRRLQPPRPDGNYLRAFSPAYFTDRYENEWGEAINFDGADAGPVREFFIANAGYWIDEFHLDGLRLDATQQIYDRSPEHIIAAIGRRVREAAGGGAILIVAENEPQDTRLVRPARGGRLRPRRAVERRLPPQRDGRAHRPRARPTTPTTAASRRSSSRPAKYGYLFQGQRYAWQEQPRGTPAWDLPPAAFVTFLQNHDQVANSGRGAARPSS